MCVGGGAQFIPSNRGGAVLIYDGFRYNRESADGKKIHWKCAEYSRARCKGRCITVGTSVTRVSGTHIHDPPNLLNPCAVAIAKKK